MRPLKEKVIYCLKKYPETRNSDIKLTNAVWVDFYQGFLFRDGEGSWCVRLLSLYSMPREDDIKRVRATIQNKKHLFLPTDWEVAKQRKIKEEVWRSYLGYNPELRKV